MPVIVTLVAFAAIPVCSVPYGAGSFPLTHARPGMKTGLPEPSASHATCGRGAVVHPASGLITLTGMVGGSTLRRRQFNEYMNAGFAWIDVSQLRCTWSSVRMVFVNVYGTLMHVDPSLL